MKKKKVFFSINLTTPLRDVSLRDCRRLFDDRLSLLGARFAGEVREDEARRGDGTMVRLDKTRYVDMLRTKQHKIARLKTSRIRVLGLGLGLGLGFGFGLGFGLGLGFSVSVSVSVMKGESEG